MGKAQASLNRISYTIDMLLVFAFLAHGQLEFMNIDCGKPRGYHGTDYLTGLIYESDFDYVETGVTHSISVTFQGPHIPSQVNDLRSFPNGTRNCYSLTPVSPGKKYLIRASFLYGNYDGKSYFPKFDLYLGTILWETISVSSSSVRYDTMIYSVATSSYMFVCLIDTGTGTPFISSLELRPLGDDVYIHVNTTNSISMVSVDLVNFGASTNPAIRYPKDAYDRVWRSYVEPGWTKLYTTSDVGVNNYNKPPSLVMQTAVAPTSGSTLNFSTKLSDSSDQYSMYLIFMHFAELQVLEQNASRKFTISRNGIDIDDEMEPHYLSLTTLYTTHPQHFGKLDHSLYMTNSSTLPPMINAIEVYKVRDSEQLSTKSEDVDAIRDIKAFYHLKKNWTGDPCILRKFTWDGLVCNYDDSPRITTLNLTASGLNGQLRSSICNLTELQELDLSANKLTGPIPICLAKLQQLTLLNIKNSGLKGPVPKALLDKSKDGSLQIFDDNPNSSGTSNQGDISSVQRKKKSNVLIVAISTSLSIALLVLVVFGVFWKLSRHKHQKQRGLVLGSEENQSMQSNGQVFSPNNSDCRQFTYSELARITNNFSKIIGQGGFGSVYHGILPNKVPVAAKILSKASCQGPKEFQREAQLLRKIHHRNLVPFVGYSNDEDYLALVYEYMTQGDLAMHLSGQAHLLCWRDRLRIANEAAQGLEYLHKGCADIILHRDIKTSNILLDQHLEAKIADFGLSRACNSENFTQVTTAIMGTRGYLDPFSVVLDQRSDVYAFGIVLLELISGQPAVIQGAAGCMCLSDWVKEHYKRGDLDSIVDKRLQGDYNANAVWKALQTAMACVSPDTNGRPDMTMVLALLKECWEMESVNFTTSSNSNATVRSNFTTDSFFPGNDSIMAFGPSVR